MKSYRDQWRQIVAESLREYAKEAGASVDESAIVVETPPKLEMGDIAFPMFPFAKALRKGPPLIASEVAKRAGARAATGAGTASAAGPYVNVRLDPAGAIPGILTDIGAQAGAWGRSDALGANRVMLEFSCPNTNKPLHLGHLRNDAIGESLSRILAAAGSAVRKVNLINDRGVHICKSMLAYQRFGGGATPESTRKRKSKCGRCSESGKMESRRLLRSGKQ